MDKNEAVGVLKTLIDLNDSDYIKEALEMSIKSLQALQSHAICPRCDGQGALDDNSFSGYGINCPHCNGTGKLTGV